MSGILIVDDEEGILQVLSRTLNLLKPGCRVSTANNGMLAWQQLQSNTFDLVLTDHHMPGLTGLELAQQAHDRSPDLPIVLMSGGNENDRLQAEVEKLGLAGFLSKPFSICQLQYLLEAIVP